MRPLINGYRNAHDEAADDGLIEAERRQGEQGDANGVWLGRWILHSATQFHPFSTLPWDDQYPLFPGE